MATILVTGGTGMIGKSLTTLLVKRGHHVIILSRQKKNSTEKNISYAQWYPAAQTIDAAAVQQADYIVHLAGANVGEGRWTEKRKKEIRDSRVQSGNLLVKALQENENRVKAVISMSAIGWYGADAQVPNPQPFVEEDQPDNSFLGVTCQQWEAAIAPVEQLGKRLVIFRTGIVLSNEGGAYKEFKRPVQLGVATILGSGTQVISWIHIDDMVRLLLFAIENETLKGVYNAVAPQPVTNREMVTQIGKQKGFFIPVPVPSFALKIALGEMSVEVLKSATVSSKKIESAGFTFQYPTIAQAVKNLK
ncbi:MAG: TIGR01777 family oxidoreductase [Chitinophagaceae bacterium]